MNTEKNNSSDQAFNEDNKELFANITLIGMPGSGKSTLARELANYLDWTFIDTDNILQAWFGVSLQELIQTLGTDRFIQAEAKIVQELILHRCIIATGGSVIYTRESMQKLQQLGKIIYLHADYQVIEERISRHPQRGLVMPRGQNLEDMYLERVPMYRQFADLEISTQAKNLKQCVHTILEELNDQEEFPEIQ